MKRNRYHAMRRLKAALIVAVCAAAAWIAISFLLPAISPFLANAAAFSAALAMPEATAATINDSLHSHRPSSQAAAIPQESAQSSAAPAQKPEREPTAFAASSSASSQDGTSAPYPPEIPEEYLSNILEENMHSNSAAEIPIEGFRLRNYTSLSAKDIKNVLNHAMQLKFEDTAEPQVLIYHTHATESYCPYDDGIYDKRYNWRSTDNNNNVVAVGAVIVQALRDKGIATLHDTSQHDYPSYNGSYANSYRSVKDYLEHYPTIKVVLDIHRDAIERENSLIVKPTVKINGSKYAQLMIVSNCDDGSGLLPNWEENFRFAAALANRLEKNFPQLTRPVMFSHRKYNQQLSNGALLLEIGSHANTLDEAKRTAKAVGDALGELLLSTR